MRSALNEDRVPSGAVVVGVARSTAGHRALRWATAEARRREVPLCVLATAADRSPDADRSLFADVRAAVGERLTALPVVRVRSAHPVVDRLRTLSAQASMVVVPAALPGLTELVATSYSAVVVVPEREVADGPVVLGAAPWTGDEVFALAFGEAAQRGTGLIAVRVRDHAVERARDDLELALSPWTVIYPEVRVEQMVVPDQTTALLLDLSTRAQLLVLGRSARGALLGLIVGSPAVDLLGAAQCPVVVVPAAGPPHSTWWPNDLACRAPSGG